MSNKGVRLYYGILLQAMTYHPAIDDQPAYFRLQLREGIKSLGVFEAPTVADVITQVKEAGHKVWGSFPEDYSRPRTAYEFELLRMATGKDADALHKQYAIKTRKVKNGRD